MGLFSRKRPLSSYLGVPLESRLGDSTWLAPITAAGFDPARADLARVIDDVSVTSRWDTFSNRNNMIQAETSVLIVQGGQLGLAFPDSDAIRVIKRDADKARLIVGGNTKRHLVIGWGNSAQNLSDEWRFWGMRIDTQEARDLGDALRQWILD